MEADARRAGAAARSRPEVACERGVPGTSAPRVRLRFGEQPVEIRSDFLHAFIETEVVQTHLPVTVKQGPNQLRAGGLRYDGQKRVLQFDGPVRASLSTPR